MRKLLVVILVLSLLFAAFFAVAGAGIYGSPFAPVPSNFPLATRRAHDMQRLLMALTVLVGPLACAAALAIQRRFPRSASIPLVLGVIAGVLLGTATKFVYVWEWVFLITVWLPMVFAAIAIGGRNRPA
jgi:hypothetical protein